MGSVQLICERCNNKTDFIEETTVRFEVDEYGVRTSKHQEITNYICNRCRKKVMPYGQEL